MNGDANKRAANASEVAAVVDRAGMHDSPRQHHHRAHDASPRTDRHKDVRDGGDDSKDLSSDDDGGGPSWRPHTRMTDGGTEQPSGRRTAGGERLRLLLPLPQLRPLLLIQSRIHRAQHHRLHWMVHDQLHRSAVARDGYRWDP